MEDISAAFRIRQVTGGLCSQNGSTNFNVRSDDNDGNVVSIEVYKRECPQKSSLLCPDTLRFVIGYYAALPCGSVTKSRWETYAQ